MMIPPFRGIFRAASPNLVAGTSIAIMLALTTSAIGFDPRASAPTGEALPGPVAAATTARLVEPTVLRDSIRREGRARVIVELAEPIAVDAPDTERMAAVAAAQERVLRALPPGAWRTTHRYELLAMLAGEVDGPVLQQLRSHRDVVAIYPDRQNVPLGVPMLAEAVDAMNVRSVWQQYGLTGDGVRVAVFDTGVDADHPDLAADIVDQRCYSEEGGCGTNNASQGDVANDEDGHGTGITGIITSDGVVAPKGIAPDAEIVAVRVFDRSNRSNSSDVIAGLEWLERNRRRLDVKVVNMSLGTEKPFVGNCDAQDPRADAIARLARLGVTVFAASGNHGSDNSIAGPACIRDVIAVGATYDADLGRFPPEGEVAGCFDPTTSPLTITCFSNVSRQLDLVAPGAVIRTTRLGGGTRLTAGTSNASPAAAGVAALLLQADPSLRTADLRRTLADTGVEARKVDGNLGVPRIDALAAVRSLDLPTVTPEGPTPSPTPTVTDTPPASSPTQTPTGTPTGTATGTAAPSTATPPTVPTASPDPTATEPAPITPTGSPAVYDVYLPWATRP